MYGEKAGVPLQPDLGGDRGPSAGFGVPGRGFCPAGPGGGYGSRDCDPAQGGAGGDQARGG